MLTKQPRIVVLATGGTIAGAQPKAGEAGYKAGAFSVDALISWVALEIWCANHQTSFIKARVALKF